MYEEILYEVDDPVATITLNRPEVLNAWTPRMGDEVRHAVWRAQRDPRVVGIVLTGAGRGFCAGADLGTLGSIVDGGAEVLAGGPPEHLSAEPGAPDAPDDLRKGEYTYLLAVPKPVIAAINGAVAGLAVPLVLACDLRFMADDAVLTVAFSQRGLIAEWGVAWLLPRLVGTGAALDLLLSSRKVSGVEAAAMGVVNRSLPREEILPFAQGYVRELAAGCSPASLATIKRQVHQHMHAGLAMAEAEARELMHESFERPDFAEGVQAFVERRTPTFRRLGGPALGKPPTSA